MSMIRYLASAALLAALPGCNQSLFDANGERGRDGSVAGPDARVTVPDARMGDGEPDAAMLPGCPEPCTADAYRDFTTVQNAPWRYAEIQPDPHGTRYIDMTLSAESPSTSWIGSGSEPPAITSCGTGAQPAPCGDLTNMLVLSTTSSLPEAHHPALIWTAPATASYRLLGSWQTPMEATGTPQFLRLARNSQFDLVEQQLHSDSTPLPFDLVVDAVAGDAIVLSGLAVTARSGRLGARFFISQQPGLTSCLTAIHFGAGTTFSNQCGSGMFVDATGTTLDDAPPPGIPGRARRFVDGASLDFTGDPNDYSQDWTVQFWAMLDDGGASDQWLLSDLDCIGKGGIGVRRNGNTLRVEFLHADAEPTDCATGALPGGEIDVPATGEWHFFRISRTRAQGLVRLCIDGGLSTAFFIPVEPEMATTRPMTLGRKDALPGQFLGRIADLRVFDTALPCLGT
jgi:hypothetical protein